MWLRCKSGNEGFYRKYCRIVRAGETGRRAVGKADRESAGESNRETPLAELQLRRFPP